MSYRTVIFVSLMLLALVAGAAGSRDFDAALWLRWNAEVESGNNARRVGPRGEVGRQQMLISTVRQHTRETWRMGEPAFAAEIERRHLEWIRRELSRSGYPADAYHCALAWHAGLAATIDGRTTAGQRAHAQRVANLYEEARR